MLAYQIGYLSNFIPVPGGIGVLDGSLIGMLVLYGIGGTLATAATLAYHAISLWVPAIWGTIAFVAVQKTKHEPLVLRGSGEVPSEPG
ncbi:MAG: lysylphosphatidylglycerol synthase domain-containing protein [Solirubrobacteraceae bacterium]